MIDEPFTVESKIDMAPACEYYNMCYLEDCETSDIKIIEQGKCDIQVVMVSESESKKESMDRWIDGMLYLLDNIEQLDLDN